MTDERIQARAIEKHTEVVQVPNVQIRNMIYMVRGSLSRKILLQAD